MRAGYWLADWVPALNYFPDSLAPWRIEARNSFNQMIEFWSVFFDSIVARMKNGDAPDCFLKRFLESPEVSNYSNVDRRVILSELLGAGSETTATTLQWFFKAAVLYPEFTRSAQEELDQIVGPERLPDWEDRPKLPYISAVIEELHRWASLTPLGIFHATSDSDTYRETNIPAKTTIISNLYAVHHGSQYYQHHEKFIPERFLPKKDPRYAPGLTHAPIQYAFGVGRRECPGKHVADASLFIVISRLLWAFNIELGANPPPSDDLGMYLLCSRVP
jgi:cytochrome P450